MIAGSETTILKDSQHNTKYLGQRLAVNNWKNNFTQSILQNGPYNS